jgi:hypothetical protein
LSQKQNTGILDITPFILNQIFYHYCMFFFKFMIRKGAYSFHYQTHLHEMSAIKLPLSFLSYTIVNYPIASILFSSCSSFAFNFNIKCSCYLLRTEGFHKV